MNLIEAGMAREVFWETPDRIRNLEQIKSIITRLLVAQPTGDAVDTRTADAQLRVGIEVTNYRPVDEPHLRLVTDTSAEKKLPEGPLAQVLQFPLAATNNK